MHLHRGRIRTELPSAAAKGKTATGVWKTAASKEYAPALCRSLVTALIEAFGRAEIASEVPEPSEDFLHRCRSMEDTDFGTEIGADFAISWN